MINNSLCLQENWFLLLLGTGAPSFQERWFANEQNCQISSIILFCSVKRNSFIPYFHMITIFKQFKHNKQKKNAYEMLKRNLKIPHTGDTESLD